MTRKGDPAKRTAKQIRQMNRAKNEKRQRQIKQLQARVESLQAKVQRIQAIIQRLKSEPNNIVPKKTTSDVSIMDKKQEYNKDYPTLILPDVQVDSQVVVCDEVLAIIQRLKQSNADCECIVKE